MDISVEMKNAVGLYETPLLHQTSFWSLVKQLQGVKTLAFDIKVPSSDMIDGPLKDHYQVDDVLVLLQRIGHGRTIGYVPYGPAIKPLQERYGMFLESLSESLRPFVGKNCIMLRYDIPWESPWADDEDTYDEYGDWIGPPDPSVQEMRLNFATQHWNLRKASTDILPIDTTFVSLREPSEIILKNMKNKTRYNIQLSSRKHVQVRPGTLEDIEIFYDLYRQTCKRNGINLHDKFYFEAMFKAAVTNRHPQEGFDMLVAEINKEPLSAMFLTYSGSRATYLFGASASYGRETMSTYALQWEAIQRAQAHRCTEYDMFGTAPNRDESHPMHGLYRFKMGFGGRAFHRMGCWDYPLDNDAYHQYTATEMVGQGYHSR